MDPLTAISLASNIISFIDFGAKLFNSAQEIYESASGATADTLSYGSIARDMEVFSTKLIPPDGQGQLSGHEKAICDLARECKVLATDIRKLLEKAKPRDPNQSSRLHSFVSAAKALRYDKQRGELQARLENCRSQLSLQLSYMTGSEIKDKLDILASSFKDNSDRAVQLQRQVEELHDSLKATTSSDGRSQIQMLLQMSESTFHDLINHKIIESLAFNDMYGRFDAVAPAHYKTFKWIFHGDVDSHKSVESDGSEDPSNNHRDVVRDDAYCSKARESFLSWLSSGHGIFHISGKLGSGKSTLMKFLCEDSRTMKILREWAGNSTLVMASFFFWKPGSKLQKSMDGLLRALLHESLQSVPDIVPDVFPTQWNEIVSMPWKTHTTINFRSQDLRDAFDRLIDCQTDNLRFCYFIDGLDEYEETFQDDNQSIIRKLKHWCGNTSGGVKICVSSREYNVFMNSLPAERRIRMQYLTQKDMLLYVRDKIDFLRDSAQMEKLVQAITSKADGIFLWVALVTKRLRDLKENGVSFQRISEEIDQIPQGLEKLFNHVLMSLNPTDMERAYKTFSIILFLQRYNFSLPLLAYTFIDDDEEDPGSETVLLQNKDLAATPEKELLARARKMLRGYCKGLVEETTRPFDWDKPVMSYTHRSVPEFLERFLRNTEAALRKFELPKVISYILLKYLWAKDEAEHYSSSYFEWLSNVSYIILKVRWDAQIDDQHFSVEKQLDLALARLGAEPIPKYGNYTEYMIQTASTEARVLSGLSAGTHGQFAVCGSFLLAALIGNSQYVQWRLSQNSSIAETPFMKTILFYSAYCGFDIENSDTPKILHLLLETGFCPQIATTMSIGNTGRGEPIEVSVWQQLILATLEWGHETRSDPTREFFWEWSLENRADPHFAVRIPLRSIEQEKTEFEAILIIGKERRRIKSHIIILFPRSISSQEYPDPEGEGILLTLTDIIDLWNFGNKDKLLAFIERNTRCLEMEKDSGETQETLPRDGVAEKEKEDTASEAFLENRQHDMPGPDRDEKWMLLVYLLGVISALMLVRLMFN